MLSDLRPAQHFRHVCRYAGEPTGSRQAPAQPPLHNGSQSQPAAASGNSPAMPIQAETDTASSEHPSRAQSPVDRKSQPQPGAAPGDSPGAPTPSGADAAGSQASASFVAGPQAGDVEVGIVILHPWHSIWSWRDCFAIGWAAGGVVQRPKARGLSTESKTTQGNHLEPLSQGSGDILSASCSCRCRCMPHLKGTPWVQHSCVSSTMLLGWRPSHRVTVLQTDASPR